MYRASNSLRFQASAGDLEVHPLQIKVCVGVGGETGYHSLHDCLGNAKEEKPRRSISEEVLSGSI